MCVCVCVYDWGSMLYSRNGHNAVNGRWGDKNKIKQKKKIPNPFQEFQFGVPVVAQWLTNPTRNHEVADSIPGLARMALPCAVV